MENSFGQEIPEIKDIVHDKVLRDYLIQTIPIVLDPLGNTESGLAERVLQVADEYSGLSDDYEPTLHHLLCEEGIIRNIISGALANRVKIIYGQIEDHIIGESILDLGCGHGKIGATIAQKKNALVELADVYKDDNIGNTGLNFIRLEEGKPISSIEGDKYCTTLLIAVLHHSSNPRQLLSEARRVTKNRIVVLETVYGVDNDDKESAYEGLSKRLTEDYKNLSYEQQRMLCVYFDHLYNRVILFNPDPDKRVNITNNYRRASGNVDSWKIEFERSGLRIIGEHNLGIDNASSPEYHKLYVLNVEKFT